MTFGRILETRLGQNVLTKSERPGMTAISWRKNCSLCVTFFGISLSTPHPAPLITRKPGIKSRCPASEGLARMPA